MPCVCNRCSKCQEFNDNLCKIYHVADIKNYNKDEYESEILYRIHFCIKLGYLNENDIKKNVWLNKLDKGHSLWMFLLLKKVNDNNHTIKGIDIVETIKNYQNYEVYNETEEESWTEIIRYIAKSDANMSLTATTDLINGGWEYYNEPEFNFNAKDEHHLYSELNNSLKTLYYKSYVFYYNEMLDLH